MSQASYSAHPGTIGTASQNGVKVVRVIPTQLNDATHICMNPDQGRMVMRHASTGIEYTTVASSPGSASGVTLIHEGI